jgi:hypothetical protein
MDEIAHLDFGADRVEMPPLRQRALEAYRAFSESARLEILHYAQRKVLDAIGEVVADDIEVTITNIKDGDGEVNFAIDGLRFQVKVGFPADRAPGDEPKTVNLTVKTKGGGLSTVDSLPELGRLIDAERVE